MSIVNIIWNNPTSLHLYINLAVMHYYISQIQAYFPARPRPPPPPPGANPQAFDNFRKYATISRGRA